MKMKTTKRQRGGTLVEAAIVLPILLAFIPFLFDFGRAYNVYQIATNAAREGARYAVAPTVGNNGVLPTSTQVTVVVNHFLQSGGVCPTQDCTTITQDTRCRNFGTCDLTNPANTMTYTKVSVVVPYHLIAAQFLGINTGINLRTSAEMRNETN